MFWNHALDGPWTMVLGGMMLVAAWLLWRGHRLGAVSRRRDTAAEARNVISERERAESGRLGEMFVRLEEFRREVDAVFETRTKVLERLVSDADREIARLLDAIAEARGHRDHGESNGLRISRMDASEDLVGSELPGAERETIKLLYGAGFEADEIARLVDQPTALVAAVLDDVDRGFADAA